MVVILSQVSQLDLCLVILTLIVPLYMKEEIWAGYINLFPQLLQLSS